MAMSEAELRRMRNDLETVREAAGLTLPFDWADVWVALTLVPAGAICTAVGAFVPLRWMLLCLAPLLLPLSGSVWLWLRRPRATERAPARYREYRIGWSFSLIMGVGMLGYSFWGMSRGFSPFVLAGAAEFFFGLACAGLALTSPGRRMYLGATAALVPYGIVIPLCSSREIVIYGGCAIMLAGLVAAAIQAGQLFHARRPHEPTPH
jgi:hypothetical protein